MTAAQAATLIDLTTYGFLAVCYALGFVGGNLR